MSLEVLDALLRVKMNSKWKNIIEFPANFFTEKWLDVHMRCDDPSCSVPYQSQGEVYRAEENKGKDMNDNNRLLSKKGH